MVRKILAAVLSVAMVASLFSAIIVNAGEATAPSATVVYEEDFEGETPTQGADQWTDGTGGALSASQQIKLVEDPDDSANKALRFFDTGWGYFRGKTDMFTTDDPDSEYTIMMRVKGDCSNLAVGQGAHYELNVPVHGAATKCLPAFDSNWKWVTAKITGMVKGHFIIMCQSTNGFLGGKMYIDDITIYEGDVKEQCDAYVQTLVPTPAPTPEATPTPVATEAPTTAATEAVATVAPTTAATTGAEATAAATAVATAAATAAPTTTPSAKPVAKKVTIKFAKKAVKIKKGKQATLKVSLKNAKKADFSTNNKKVAKIVKKAAKAVTVKGMKKGKAVITAKASKKKATCKVTVK